MPEAAKEEPTTRELLSDAYDEHMEEETEEEEVVETPDLSDDEEEEEEDHDDPALDEADLDPDADDEGDEEEDDDEGAADEDEKKAPQSWSPEARESWAEVPERARQEIAKRELEMQQRLTKAGHDTKMARDFNTAVDPYRAVIQMEAGGDAIRATASLMDLATRLRMGTPAEKSQVVTDIIKNYAVDLGSLDDALFAAFGEPGSTPAPAPAAPQPAADPRVEAMWAEKQQQTNSAQDAAQEEFNAFMSSKEFANDVQNEMGLVFQNATQRGETLTLDQAYDRACAMRPDIREILSKREPVNQGTSLKRKRRAAKGIKSSSTPTPAGGETDLRGMLSQKWDEAQSSG